MEQIFKQAKHSNVSTLESAFAAMNVTCNKKWFVVLLHIILNINKEKQVVCSALDVCSTELNDDEVGFRAQKNWHDRPCNGMYTGVNLI